LPLLSGAGYASAVPCSTKACDLFRELAEAQRDVYQPARLLDQSRRPIAEYVQWLRDPHDGSRLQLEGGLLRAAARQYPAEKDIADFTPMNPSSPAWARLNRQFLDYHRSLTPHTLLNSAPVLSYVSLHSGIGRARDQRVLDVGGGTGHTLCSFFLYPETI
jgi:hypothetical protein